MTNREFFTAVSTLEGIPAELTKFSLEAIEKMDERNAKRNAKPSKKAIANEPVKESIVGVLTTEPQTASVIAAQTKLSTQKASALLRQLVAEGQVVQSEVKVPKKGKQKAYAIIDIEEESEDKGE